MKDSKTRLGEGWLVLAEDEQLERLMPRRRSPWFSLEPEILSVGVFLWNYALVGISVLVASFLITTGLLPLQVPGYVLLVPTIIFGVWLLVSTGITALVLLSRVPRRLIMRNRP